jgi:hypothetical protein
VTLLELARSTTDPQLAISLTEKAADLKALVDELSAGPDPILESDIAPREHRFLISEFQNGEIYR